MNKIKNTYLFFKDQLPFSRLVRNIATGDIVGALHPRSHRREDGQSKVMYNTKPSAQKAAASMEAKSGKHFGVYKCYYCPGYHIGKKFNQDPS